MNKRWKANAVNLCKKCSKVWGLILVRNAVKCSELFFFHQIHLFHRISYINLPENLLRWILRWFFVRNAVKYLFSPHSPQSPHFLRQFTAFTPFPKSLSTEFSIYLPYFKNVPKNLDPGSTIIRRVNKSKKMYSKSSISNPIIQWAFAVELNKTYSDFDQLSRKPQHFNWPTLRKNQYRKFKHKQHYVIWNQKKE